MTSVAIQFDRPVGVHRDIAEIEFVTALLQTSKTFLRNRVSAKDVMIYMRSRHGIVITEDVASQLLVKELAGATCDTTEHDCIDPCQLLAILLIPQFLQEFRDRSSNQQASIVEAFSKEIDSFKSGNQLTVASLRRAMAKAGETSASESLLQEMVTLLNQHGGDIGKVLTSDIDSYQPELAVSAPSNSAVKTKPDLLPSSEQAPPVKDVSVVHSPTAAFIDFTSDTYRRPVFHALLASCGIATYFAYVLNIEHEWLQCDTQKTVCEVGKGLVAWLTLFMQLVVLGLPFVVLGSLGNCARISNPVIYVIRSLISIVAISMFTIYPYFVVSDVKDGG